MSGELILGLLLILGALSFAIAWLNRGSARRDYPDSGPPPLRFTRAMNAADDARATREWLVEKDRRIGGWQFNSQVSPLYVHYQVLDIQTPAEVASSSEPGRSWIVDLAARTCTCPDFAKRRAALEKTDIRRFCKHAIQVMDDAAILDDLDPLAGDILADEHATSFDTVCVTHIGSHRVALAFSDHGEWVNLFAPVPGTAGREYTRHGYNLRERRWAYGDGPRHVRGAAAAIRAMFTPIKA